MDHLVGAAKYRRVVINRPVDEGWREVGIKIKKRWGIRFWEIGWDRDDRHFLIQSLPRLSPNCVVHAVGQHSSEKADRSVGAGAGRRVR